MHTCEQIGICLRTEVGLLDGYKTLKVLANESLQMFTRLCRSSTSRQETCEGL